jgi:hypothetical protein
MSGVESGSRPGLTGGMTSGSEPGSGSGSGAGPGSGLGSVGGAAFRGAPGMLYRCQCAKSGCLPTCVARTFLSAFIAPALTDGDF